ncbi:hypothetical protein [Serratia sp. Se-RSBMAAmG]|uniref:hypothetical protein n=1 Tax=Serratia sp. Se-RSBMAAmG TaxID=3043305 RepID=UPI0024AF6923|nr:hypothetical protein [Serratia sp. Se-RSBMAAmG]MDI6977251.1 hypothetical protein [Serratia sp. Se-RSBMAAmG]
MPLYNELRARECKCGYKIQYFGGWFKRWKTLSKYQYGDPSIYGIDVLPMTVILNTEENAEEYVRARVTMMDLESVSVQVLQSHHNIRLVRYTANDGVFYHVEEREKSFGEKWLTAEAWRLTHEENECVDIRDKVLNKAEVYIKMILRYEAHRASIYESMPC